MARLKAFLHDPQKVSF